MTSERPVRPRAFPDAHTANHPFLSGHYGAESASQVSEHSARPAPLVGPIGAVVILWGKDHDTALRLQKAADDKVAACVEKVQSAYSGFKTAIAGEWARRAVHRRAERSGAIATLNAIFDDQNPVAVSTEFAVEPQVDEYPFVAVDDAVEVVPLSDVPRFVAAGMIPRPRKGNVYETVPRDPREPEMAVARAE